MSGPVSVERSNDLPPLVMRLFKIAQRDPRRGVSFVRRMYDHIVRHTPLHQAIASYVLGYALLQWERLDEAEQYLVESEHLMQSLKQERLHLHVRRALLYLELLRGGRAGSAEAWGELASVYENKGDPLSAARARLGQMVQWNMQGHADKVRQRMNDVEDVFAVYGTPGDRAWFCRVVGVMYAGQGKLEASFQYLDEAATLFSQLGYRAERVKTWIERAYAYDLRENPGLALVELERAYHWACRLDLPVRIATCEKNIGWMYTLRGEYDLGIRFSLSAHDRFIALKRQGAAADCDLNLGNVAYYAGLWDLALIAYKRAERVYKHIAYEQMYVVCRRNQAMVRRAEGHSEESLRMLTELLPVVEQLGFVFEQAETIHATAQALLDVGRSQEALQAFERAERLFRAYKNEPAAGEALLGHGLLRLQWGEIEQATQDLQEAYTLLEERPIHQWRATYGLGSCAERRGDTDLASRLYHDACLTVAQLRQHLANEHASSGLFVQAQHLFIDALTLAWHQRDGAMALELAELQRALVLARTVYATRATAVAEKVNDATDVRQILRANQGLDDAIALEDALQVYREGRLRNRHLQAAIHITSRTMLDLSTIRGLCQQAFPAGWTILEYIPCGDRLLIVTVQATTITMDTIAFDTRLQNLLKSATSSSSRISTYYMEGNAAPSLTDGWQTLSELGTRLLPTGILAQTRPDHRLLIIAGGAFHNLPWSALRIQNSWIVEQVTPQLLPSLQLWPELAKRQPASWDALAIGVEHFGDREHALPSVLATLDLVERVWQGNVTRLEAVSRDMLRDSSVKGDLRRFGLVHISTHGQRVSTSGLLTHLKLADEDLLYDDILDLDMTGALVVLAACEGAASEVLPGEEVLSLSRAFLAAGARDVIASQWQMYDNVIVAFLQLLYDRLTAHCDAPTALALAQREWIKQYNDHTEMEALVYAPLVWASVCAIGAGTTPKM